MNAPLYTPELLRLAAEGALIDPLPFADVEAELRARLCGSRVRITLKLDPGAPAETRPNGGPVICAYGHDVSACVFGQAAAALLARGAVGADLVRLRRAREDLAAWLMGKRSDPGDWPGLNALAAARAYPARHPSILLPFDTAIRALETALETSTGPGGGDFAF